ncbi:MAG: UDP-N-acetylglucosamine 2-epimerase (non-hydrolyzing) [Planctomycetota bacterium]|nr:UDP-N-acetylglucosamine 2-epimerase (non-hydrolyzing) [Planctomycetota bacterium]
MADSLTIMTVVGARPQFIKAAVVSRLAAAVDGAREILVHTGQHYDENMSSLFFEELSIPEPEHHLEIGSGHHGAQTGAMLEAIERLILDDRPDWVLVYGDTNSTIAGALAAAKLHVPVAHVEAGMRSFNRAMPEELNRVLTDHLSTLNLTSTDTATRNLGVEGIGDSRIVQVGDVMYDAARFYSSQLADTDAVLSELGVKPGGFILATLHRAENTDVPTRLAALVEAFEVLGKEHRIILPLHPRTRKMLERSGDLGRLESSVSVHEPMGYLEMITLEREASLVMTDSGGVQKEAFFHGTPCVTLRDETEWVELVESGWNRIVPPLDSMSIIEGVSAAIGTRGDPVEPYGDGHAGERIMEALAGVHARVQA